jgi:hypothetical protein
LRHGIIGKLTKEELWIIYSALNEVCNGSDLEGKFETFLGLQSRRGAGASS